jgi:hypothetical protein
VYRSSQSAGWASRLGGRYVPLFQDTTNVCSGSTTWEWRKCKVKGAPAGDGVAQPKAAPSRFSVSRARRKRNIVEIAYRGGPESSWLFSLDGRSRRLPGHLCIEDAMALVLGETDPRCETRA